MKKLFAFLAGAALVIFVVTNFIGKEVKVSELWSPASHGGDQTAVVYMTIDNHGDDMDTLQVVETQVARHATIERDGENNGAKITTELKSLDIAGGESMVMKPRGTYVLLTGLSKGLVKGEKYPIQFVFSKRGYVEDTFSIEDKDATAYNEH
jgi:copper(I)-binding protein